MGDTPHGKRHVGCHVESPSGKGGVGTIVCGKCRRSQELVEILQGGGVKAGTLQNLSELALLRDGSHAETRPAGAESLFFAAARQMCTRRRVASPLKTTG